MTSGTSKALFFVYIFRFDVIDVALTATLKLALEYLSWLLVRFCQAPGVHCANEGDERTPKMSAFPRKTEWQRAHKDENEAGEWHTGLVG